jgi:hypothetical protein
MSHATQRPNRRYLHDSLEMITRHGLPGYVTSTGCQTIPQAVTRTVKSALESSLEEEFTPYLGFARAEHVPWGRRPAWTRRGTYTRALLPQYGCMPDLRMPKFRRGTRDSEWQTSTRDERGWGPCVDQHIRGSC